MKKQLEDICHISTKPFYRECGRERMSAMPKYVMDNVGRDELVMLDGIGATLTESVREAMADAILHNEPVGMIAGYYDEQLSIWTMSRYFLSNLGYTVESFMHMTGGSLLGVISRDTLYPFSETEFRRVSGIGEYYMLSGSGSPVFMRVYKADAFDPQGRRVWVLSTRNSRASQNLSLINGMIQTGTWSIDYDLDGHVTRVEWGNSVRKLLGFTTQEEFPNTIEAWDRQINPEDGARIKAFFREVPFQKERENFEVECRLRMKHGDYEWFRASARVVRRADGTVDSIVGILMNTNEEKKASERENRILQDNTAMGQLIRAVVQMTDRFFVCNLEENRYEYYEKSNNVSAYRSNGCYSELVADWQERFLALKTDRGQRIDELLSVNRLRSMLHTEEDKLTLDYCTRDKSEYRMLSVVPIAWKDDALTKVVMIAQNVLQKYEYENMANTDPLTGLFNRRYLTTVLRALTERKETYGLFFLDLDSFKLVNDTYGHDVGDKLLSAVAQRLCGCIRGADLAYRIGGDEFALTITGTVDSEVCETLKRRIDKIISRPFSIDDLIIQARISVGYAIYPSEGEDEEQIRVLADKRMYSDKESHKTENG